MALRGWLKLLLLSMAVGLHGAEKIQQPEAKVAIVFQDAKGEPLADAAMAELTGQKIICLERTEIKKVLEEQKLSASGLVNPANIVKCCRLLKVDVFAVIVCSPKNQVPVGLIVFDTRLGLRLADVLLPEKFEDQVRTTTDTVISAISRKQQLNDGKLKLVSFLPLNLIALQGREAASARVVELVVMQLLGQNQNFLVLERSQLDFLLKERNLHPDADNQLLTGSLFIQLESELSGEKEKTLIMKLFIKDLAGKVYFSLKESYAVDAEVKLAERLVMEMVKQLGAAVVSGNFDRKAEATKYINESRIAIANGMYERASRMARNAYALNADYYNEFINVEEECISAYLSCSDNIPPEVVETAVGHIEFLFETGVEYNHRLNVVYNLGNIRDSYYEYYSLQQLKRRVVTLRKQMESAMLDNYNRKYKPIKTISSINDMEYVFMCIDNINTIAQICRNNEINNKYGLPLLELYVANIDRFYTPGMKLLTQIRHTLFMPDSGEQPKEIASRLKNLYCAMQKTSVPYYKIQGILCLLKLNQPDSVTDSSYNDFIIEIFENDPRAGQDWLHILKWYGWMYFSSTSDACGLKLCRSIYKKQGFNDDFFSDLCGRIRTYDAAMEFYSFINEIRSDVRNDKTMSSETKDRIIRRIEKDYIRNLKLKFPKLKMDEQKPAKVEYANVSKRIFNLLPNIPDSILARPLYNGKNIYVVRITANDRVLYRISPEHNFDNQAGEKLLFKIDNRCLNEYLTCLSKEHYVMATSSGLFLFPLNLSTPEYIPLKEFNGFKCYGIACINEKIYMSYDNEQNEAGIWGSSHRNVPLYLVEYDLRKKHTQ